MREWVYWQTQVGYQGLINKIACGPGINEGFCVGCLVFPQSNLARGKRPIWWEVGLRAIHTRNVVWTQWLACFQTAVAQVNAKPDNKEIMYMILTYLEGNCEGCILNKGAHCILKQLHPLHMAEEQADKVSACMML